ncbi:TPA: hypothetical protein ACUBBO_004615, partial [Escherichia coli]
RAGGGADFIFSASQRVVMAFSRPAGALVCLRGVLCGGEGVMTGCKKAARRRRCSAVVSVK